MFWHVMPINDLEEHIESVMCICDPQVSIIEETNDYLVTHNSFDGREGVELANEILKK